MRYKLVTVEGKISQKDKMSLEDMQKFVGGYIEYSDNIICNEEGLLLGLPKNKVYNRFVGNVIIEERGK